LKVRKLIAAVAAVSVCGMLAFAGIAVAGGATTKVTIEAQQGGFFGNVHTKASAAEKCENGRKVVLYKQKGSSQRPRQDTKIGSDIAQPNGPDAMWSINTDKSGKFYAKAVETAKCHHAFSDTVRSQ
jgi:ABC-type glycerol-3-phosphate transport system substrate-binding protein